MYESQQAVCKDISLLILLQTCLQSEKVVEIVCCDLSDLPFAKKLFECLLTMIIFFYEYD